MTTVYLTINTVNWLWRNEHLAGIPKCISLNRLLPYKTLHPSPDPVLLDSGGFRVLQDRGYWTSTPAEYVERVRWASSQLGNVVAIAPQDWMCESIVIQGGRTKDGNFVGTRHYLDPEGVLTEAEIVREHQRRTVENFIELRRLAPDLPIFPVLQAQDDYLEHVAMYAAAGVDLAAEPLVGIGSVCRRQGTREVDDIVRSLAGLGLKLHGFGVGVAGLSMYGHLITQSDSNAWSFNGRREVGLCPHGVVKHEANCPVKALTWWERANARLAEVTA